ncbi:peptidylprolyl isomerase [Actinomadura hallensis]|uniref:peptidylprolyl isomerase n=1 Tax=Actinomadura hallensis TaxID=337895 RepID=A0A543IJW2_9ACTN|nr:FKBP-type peptidyl-prolyl cis-trans isomerase [Actinomadura hallensis]TQM70853.1 peptidylprolyl isomerase [Actinomadura hallensis]HLV76043.1 FKBP-type peptidyl-prolyl cis-trans isomerase [Vulgatibacteraceae bacterium]
MSEDDKPGGKPTTKAKAKIPNAQNIRSPEFRPHGISAGRGSGLNRPSALTAAQARRRRRLTILALVLAGVLLAGFVWWWINRPPPEIEVSGKFAAKPTVEIPKKLAPEGKRKVTTLIKGDGPEIKKGDTLYAQYVFYQWSKDRDEEDRSVKSKSKELASSYERDAQGQSQPLVVGESGIKGFDEGMIGQTGGSRVLLQIPPSEGFGDDGAQLGLTKSDWVVFVVDVQAVVHEKQGPEGTEKKLDDKSLPKVEDKGDGKAPKVTIPDRDAPDKLRVETLVEGNGPALEKGDDAVLNYQGTLWDTGKEFDSSWKSGTPAKFPIGTGQTVPGFDKGLTGAKVGSRLLLVLPPSEGYGKEGRPPTIKGDDTLVFVVDVLAKVRK